MEGSGRRLGWIAIGIGVVALMVALFGRGVSFGRGADSWAAVGPQAQVEQFRDRGGREGFFSSPSMRETPRSHMEGREFFMARGPHGGFGGFFWPLALLGGLAKLLLWILVIFLVLKLFRRGPAAWHGNWRGDQPGGPPAGSPPSGSSPPPPGPERPPYTGETTNL